MWIMDLKKGFCSTDWYLNKSFCCPLPHCPEWWDWNTYGLGWMVYVLSSVLFATISAYLVQQWAPFARGSGIPETKTILGGFMIPGFLSFRTLMVKMMGVILSVASGLSVGKEGPLVHIACALTQTMSHWTAKYKYNQANTRELLSAACAGGVSVAFGAPIGGVLFSLEEVSFYFPHKTMFRSFYFALVSALALQFVNPFRTGIEG
jgi:chloride channel 3/4/5